MPNQQIKLQTKPMLATLALFLLFVGSVIYLGHAKAAPFDQAFVRLDTLKAATATGGRICAQPTTAATEASVQVTFPTTGGTDYTVNATASNWTVDTTNLDTDQTAWPGIGTATAVSGKTVTFPSSDLTVGTLYCFNFGATSTLTTSSAGAAETSYGSITTRTTAPATIDTTQYSLSIITDDAVVISGVVPPSFSFVLSGNTDAFTTDLNTSSVVSTSGRTVTITTNAQSGWIVWVKDLNSSSGKGALQSATASNYKIAGSSSAGASSHTLSTGSEDYGLGATISSDASGGGTVSLDAAYDGTGSKAGTLDPTRFRPIASSSGTANGDVINIVGRATIAGQTPAASDYTDTMTVIGAGLF
jgi:hypothetical protein